MPTYPKRNESSIVTAAMSWLQAMENLGQITFYTRIQSGVVSTVKRYTKKDGTKKEQFGKMRLARQGTADLLIVLKKGQCVWVEAKLGDEKPSKEQIAFMDKMMTAGHHYVVIREVDDLVRYLNKIGV